jgi:hypothetical protein
VISYGVAVVHWIVRIIRLGSVGIFLSARIGASAMRCYNLIEVP